MIRSEHSTFLLAPGDRMELAEFLERWEQSPGIKFAELIDGIVYTPSPVSVWHGRLNSLAQWVFGYYGLRSGICAGLTNATWLMLDNAPQPDLALSLKPEYGGNMTVLGNLASGYPELVIEVCRSSRSYDLGAKLDLYERVGVPEYLAILIEERRFEPRFLNRGRYQLMRPEDGIFRSRMFPGLWVDEAAYWSVEEPRLIDVLDEGLKSPELLQWKQTGNRSPYAPSD